VKGDKTSVMRLANKREVTAKGLGDARRARKGHIVESGEVREGGFFKSTEEYLGTTSAGQGDWRLRDAKKGLQKYELMGWVGKPSADDVVRKTKPKHPHEDGRFGAGLPENGSRGQGKRVIVDSGGTVAVERGMVDPARGGQGGGGGRYRYPL